MMQFRKCNFKALCLRIEPATLARPMFNFHLKNSELVTELWWRLTNISSLALMKPWPTQDESLANNENFNIREFTFIWVSSTSVTAKFLQIKNKLANGFLIFTQVCFSFIHIKILNGLDNHVHGQKSFFFLAKLA